MIRLADGTEWNDDDYHAQLAQRHGCTRAQAKNYNVLRNYMGAFTPEELQGATRTGGKSAQLWEDIQSALLDLPKGKRLYFGRRGAGMSKSLLGEAQARFLAQEPEKPHHLLGSGRRTASMQVVWDEMNLYGGSWYMIDEHGTVWNCGVDWGDCEPDLNAGYCVVRRITRNAVTLEMRDAEDQATGLQPYFWESRRIRPGARASGSRRDRTRRAELLLHRWGSDVAELLRGIREREAAAVVETGRLRIRSGCNDRGRFSPSPRS